MTAAAAPAPAFNGRRTDRAIAAALAAATLVGLWGSERAVGFTRDESTYFYAGDLYARWYLELADNLGHGRFLASFRDQNLSRAFGFNWEHPVLMKSLFGLSRWLFADQLHWLRPAAGYRFPAWLLGGLASALIYLLGLRLFARRPPFPRESDSPADPTALVPQPSLNAARGLSVFAALAFWLTPRNLYDGHLACFDMPVAVAWLLVVVVYLRGFESRGWALATGVVFGLALCVKHNAFFYPASFALHWALTAAPAAWGRGRWRGLLGSLPRQWVWMALLGPAIFLLHWPYLWPHPIDRLTQYFAFHANHVHYPWYYLGDLLRGPPFPIFYVVVVTALTVPLALFSLMATGTLAVSATLFDRWRRGSLDAGDGDWLLVLGNGLLPLALISWPTVPHFGGTKHWLPGMPFLGLIAAAALWRCAATIGELWQRSGRSGLPVEGWATALGGGVLALALAGCLHIGGYGDSAYNELCGEGAGAAALGMQRQFWSNNVTGVLDWLDANAPAGARIYFHEVTGGSVQAYQENGLLRRDLQMVGGPQDANFVPYQYMQEFRQQEFDVWNAFGTSVPVAGLYLDEAPDVTVYRRPGG